MKRNNVNVLEVISSLGTVGGSETFSVSLSSSLNKISNLTVVILYKENNADLIKLMHFHGINPIILNKRKGFDKTTILQLKKIIKDKKIQYIHTENNALITSYFAARKMIRKGKIKLLHTLHTEPGKEGGKVTSFIMRRLFHKKNIIPVEIARTNLAKSLKYYGLNNIPLIDNGVDLSLFINDKSMRSRDIDVVVLARFENVKNHHFILDIFEICHELNSGFKGYLYGEGSKKDEILKRIASMNASEYILTPGLLERKEVIDTLKSAKILLLASHWESNSITVLEALSAGCIPVLSAVGGNKTVINNGHNGFLFELDNPNDFALKIVDIISNPDAYEIISNNASKSSVKYSIDDCAEKYIALFLDSNIN